MIAPLAPEPLDADIKAGSIIQTPRKKRPPKCRIIADPVTGLPALLISGTDIPVLTSREVDEILAGFP